METQEEQVTQEAVSEQPEVQAQGQDEPKMVPLAALEAERKKRQEAEYMLRMQENKPEPEVKEDPSALVERQDLKNTVALTKREILEAVYQEE